MQVAPNCTEVAVLDQNSSPTPHRSQSVKLS